MRELKVDLTDLELAMAWRPADLEMREYFDLETGRVIAITSEAQDCLEELQGSIGECEDAAAERAALAEAASEEDLCEVEEILDAYDVEAGWNTRFVDIPQADRRDEYRDLEKFVATVSDAQARKHLAQAIQGKGAFRRFDDLLAAYPQERGRWREFGREKVRRRIIEWLAEHDVVPVFEDRRPVELPPARPPVREVMLPAVLLFVGAAARLPGVSRIALIGSLATDKPNPKDVDLLVTVAEDMDLEPLAALGRKLRGRVQELNRGADVFLANPRGEHIGRTCPWRECGPGIRRSCDALHCGVRHYLHDDLRTVRLKKELVSEPPVELWPAVRVRVQIPEDVRRLLLDPLSKQA